jgi:putative intracellular protease/amidase
VANPMDVQVAALAGEGFVVDRNWIAGPQPSDIPAFNRELMRSIAEASDTAAKAIY